MTKSVYDRIGRTYAGGRRTDPRIARPIHAALGDAASVVNVGAGAGSYEPGDRRVIAVEPSARMISQRPSGAAPVVRGVAEALPFGDGSFDAALAVLTLHHWSDWRAGVGELRRVARRTVVLTTEIDVFAEYWLTREYFPEIIELDRGRFPTVSQLAEALEATAVEIVLIPPDCVDGFTGAYWARPEAYLQASVRDAMSGFALLGEDVVASGVARLRDDLAFGAWDERHGSLRRAGSFDLGYRLVIR